MAGEGLLTACLLSSLLFPLLFFPPISSPLLLWPTPPTLPLSPGNTGLAEQWHGPTYSANGETEAQSVKGPCLKPGTGQDKAVMRRHLQFGSWLFPPYPGDNEITPGLSGQIYLCLFLQPRERSGPGQSLGFYL